MTYPSFVHKAKADFGEHSMQTSGSAATAATVWERICRNKQPVVEPRESALFNQANEVIFFTWQYCPIDFDFVFLKFSAVYMAPNYSGCY